MTFVDRRKEGAERGAIVIGGDYRALGTVRSLGRRGVPVWVLQDEHTVAGASRYARRSLPWPALSEAEQRDHLLELCERFGLDGWALFPSGDEAAAMLANHHAVLSRRFRLTVPPWESTRWAYDKRLTYRLAEEVGVALPWTRYPASREEVASLDCSFPVVIKPAHKERELNRLTADKAWRVDTRAELLARYDEACTLVAPHVIMIQELIPGGGETQFSYAALCEDGRALASIVARRTRQHPIDFGRASSFVETVARPAAEEAGRRLLAAMRYTGLLELEFKQDPRSREYKVLDINPRIWGWHTLGARAGVDFSYLQWRLIHGEATPQTRARAGVRWVRMTTDLPAAVSYIRRGELSVKTYLWSLRPPLEFAIFAADDPLPALVDVPMLLSMLGRRARRAKGGAVRSVGPV